MAWFIICQLAVLVNSRIVLHFILHFSIFVYCSNIMQFKMTNLYLNIDLLQVKKISKLC